MPLFPQKTINNARNYAISLDKTLYDKLLFAWEKSAYFKI